MAAAAAAARTGDFMSGSSRARVGLTPTTFGEPGKAAPDPS